MIPLQDPNEAHQAVRLALVVARAAAKGHLDWWDDETLTEAGRFALSRIFPRNPTQIAVRLAFVASRDRHRGVLVSAGIPEVLTLFDLAEPALELAPLSEDVWTGPVSQEEFRRQIAAAVPQAKEPGQFAVSPNGLIDAGVFASDWLSRAAASYLHGAKRQPVFPYFRREPAPA